MEPKTERRVLVTSGSSHKVLPYLEALRALKLDPVEVPSGGTSGLEGFAGLVLTGGCDINPRHYGQPRHPEAEAPDDARDEMEIRLWHAAREGAIPVLAVCRGLQLMNVAAGGTLIQHLPNTSVHCVRGGDHAKSVHAVEIVPETRLAAIMGIDSLPVNSRHHQAVDRIGEGLRLAARSPEGVIEALELPGEPFVLGVQWHPEDQWKTEAFAWALFEAFAEAVAGKTTEGASGSAR